VWCFCGWCAVSRDLCFMGICTGLVAVGGRVRVAVVLSGLGEGEDLAPAGPPSLLATMVAGVVRSLLLVGPVFAGRSSFLFGADLVWEEGASVETERGEGDKTGGEG
jgi:hypothetical protein